MGVYFKFLCVRAGKPVLQLNPQSGYGGMKAGEFIGTDRGKVTMLLLQHHFCPPDASWGYVSDAGHSSWTNLDGEELYEQSSCAPDVGRNADFRRIAIEKRVTTQDNIDSWDAIAETQKLIADKFDAGTLAYTAPDLTDYIAQYKTSLNPVSARTRSKASASASTSAL